MANVDQAEGLRRMLEEPKPKVLTFLSALGEEEKSTMLINLGISLARQGQKVLMVDTRASQNSIGAWLNADTRPSLLDVVRQQRTMQEAIKIVSSGFSVTMLAQHGTSMLPAENFRRLSRVFDIAVNRSDLVIVDSELDDDDAFPLASLDESDVVMQVSVDPASIKSAYGLIKRLNNRIGRRSYGLLVSGATEKEAQLIYSNMAQVAGRYLAVPLKYVGYLPQDEYMKKAAYQGRSVIDAFPLARASLAFIRLAEQFSLTAQSGLHMRTLGLHMGI